MKYLFISTMESHPWGGSEFLWAQAAAELVRRGHEVSASIRQWNPENPEVGKLQARGVKIHRRILHSRKSKAARILARLKPRTNPPNLWLEQLLEKERPDLVVFSDGAVMLNPTLRLLVASKGIPYVNLSQANAEFIWPNDSQAMVMKEAATKAVACCFVSHANLELFENQIAARLPNGHVVSNPYGVPRETPFAWPTVTTTILACVGRLEPAAKGHDLLFKVLSDPKWKERDLLVRLCGTGPMEQSVRRLASMHGVESQVRFEGHVSSVADVWETSHALVMPSRYEGLPLAAVEAMMCHRPVIATPVAGIPEVVTHGETGFLSKGCTTSALDEVMEEAWQARHEWERMGMAAGRRIREMIPVNPGAEFADFLERLANRELNP